jgi:hypothetical protein
LGKVFREVALAWRRGAAWSDRPVQTAFYFAGGESGPPGDPTNRRFPSGSTKFLPTAVLDASLAR